MHLESSVPRLGGEPLVFLAGLGCGKACRTCSSPVWFTVMALTSSPPHHFYLLVNKSNSQTAHKYRTCRGCGGRMRFAFAATTAPSAVRQARNYLFHAELSISAIKTNERGRGQKWSPLSFFKTLDWAMLQTKKFHSGSSNVINTLWVKWILTETAVHTVEKWRQ